MAVQRPETFVAAEIVPGRLAQSLVRDVQTWSFAETVHLNRYCLR